VVAELQAGDDTTLMVLGPDAGEHHVPAARVVPDGHGVPAVHPGTT